MGYRNLQECVHALEATRQLVTVDAEVDPYLEVGAIQRRVYAARGPALLFTRVKGCAFPMLGNLFGTLERTRYIFRDTLDDIHRLVAAKVAPQEMLKDPLAALRLPVAALHLVPRRVSDGPILDRQCRIEQWQLVEQFFIVRKFVDEQMRNERRAGGAT